MGYSNWSDSFYRARNQAKAQRGIDAFAYDQDLKTQPRQTWKVHDKMNPLEVMRESRDSDAHPETLAIIVKFDVTGSMGVIPRILQKKLGKLMNMLIDKGYVLHPQILFGAVGDANCDRIPLQVGQFESGVEMDEDLERIVLEGGGGGQVHESYELAIYFAARKTAADCYEKRGKKGYLFIIGDEKTYKKAKREQVEEIIGDKLEKDVPVEDIIREVEEKYYYFQIIASGGCHGQDPEVERDWRKLLGERVLRLDDPEAVCELIALTIGVNEEAVNLDEGVRDLVAVGMDEQVAKNAGKALAKFAKGKAMTVRENVKANLPVTFTKKRVTRL